MVFVEVELIDIDTALGVSPAMLQLRANRAEVIASNIANVDTPNYKAKDMKFTAVMNHLESSSISRIESDVLYRVPFQKSRDGNTVELQNEQSKFAQNAMEYQQSLQFFKSKISGLEKAINGK